MVVPPVVLSAEGVSVVDCETGQGAQLTASAEGGEAP